MSSVESASTQPVRELVLNGLLPTSSGCAFELIGEVTGWGVTTHEDDTEISPVLLVLPLVADGLRTDVEFALKTTRKTRVLDEAGVEVPNSRQDAFLESLPQPVVRAVVRPMASGALRVLELQELSPGAGQQGTSTTSPAPSAGPQLRLLSGQGVLPSSAEGTLVVAGKRIGSAGTDGELDEVVLEIPVLIDGVTATMPLALKVNDETVVVDKAGQDVPRSDEERALYKVSRMWQATIRMAEKGRPVVLEMRPATGR